MDACLHYRGITVTPADRPSLLSVIDGFGSRREQRLSSTLGLAAVSNTFDHVVFAPRPIARIFRMKLIDALPFIDGLSHCKSSQQIGAAFAEFITPHGFVAAACGESRETLEGRLWEFFFNTWPAEWLLQYQGAFPHRARKEEARRQDAHAGRGNCRFPGLPVAEGPLQNGIY